MVAMEVTGVLGAPVALEAPGVPAVQVATSTGALAAPVAGAAPEAPAVREAMVVYLPAGERSITTTGTARAGQAGRAVAGVPTVAAAQAAATTPTARTAPVAHLVHLAPPVLRVPWVESFITPHRSKRSRWLL